LIPHGLQYNNAKTKSYRIGSHPKHAVTQR
jgi:hypothetical protein